MARRRTIRAQQVFWIVSLIVVASMLIGLAVTFTPPRTVRETPTVSPTMTPFPTRTPTPATQPG